MCAIRYILFTLSGTSPQRNKVLIGSGSLSPGAGTTALPVAPIALTQNGEHRQGRQYICADKVICNPTAERERRERLVFF